jgi:hypothetical protein
MLSGGCGSGGDDGAHGGAKKSGGAATAPRPGREPAGQAPDAPQARSAARHVTQTVRRATSTCLDRPRDRRVTLPPKLARLPSPLREAQRALIVARRTHRRLAGATPVRGARGQDLVAVAKARVRAMLTVNYSIERHDRDALAIGSRMVESIGGRLQADARRFGVSGCG